MVRVEESAIIDLPIGDVWEVLRDFNAHDNWHPAVADSNMQNGASSDTVSGIRDFTLVTGERVCERLLKLSDKNYSFSYSITESDVPLYNYIATVTLRPVTLSDQTYWSWTSRFDTPAGQENEFHELVSKGIYRAGFQGIRDFLATKALARRPSEPGSDAEGQSDPIDEQVKQINVQVSPQAATVTADVEQSSSGAHYSTTLSSDTNSSTIKGMGIIARKHGDSSVLEYVMTGASAPKQNEVRIAQDAIGLNFIDVYSRNGYFNLIDPPAILGMEAAGTVLDCGAGVKHVKPGDRVAYACAPTGAYTSVRTMDATHVMPLPANIDNQAAAAIMLKGITAYFLLHQVHTLSASETILVFAPAGGVGKLLVQWASKLGATVIGATSSPHKASEARQAGAHHVITPGNGSLEEQIMDLTGGFGADVAYDAVGYDSFDHTVAALKPCGHFVSYGQASGDIGKKDIGSFAAKSLTLSRPNYGHYTDTQKKTKQASDAVWQAIDHGMIKVDIGQTFSLSDAAEAHRQLEARKTTGSTLLIPDASISNHGDG